MIPFFSALFGEKDNSLLKEAIQSGAFLVDVRSSGEYESDKLPGSINIPLDSIPHKISRFKGKKNIVVFCRSGNRSSMAKSILESHGIKHIINGGSKNDVQKALNM
jgi:phage shock protein E